MQFHNNELFLLYNPQSTVGKQTKALALDICTNINTIDANREKLSPMYWKEIVGMLGMQPNDLLDHSHEDYKTMVAGKEYTMNGWLEVLSHYAHLLRAPIAIYHGKAALCQTPTDIMRLGGAVSQGDKVLPHLKRYK